MTLDSLLTIANTAVLPGWLLLIVAPRWKYSARLVSSVLIPALLAIAYAWLVSVGWGEAEGDMDTISGIQSFFETREILVAGWIHYLAFDLFVGSWQVREAQRVGMPHWAVLPCLLLTLMFGPAGLLLFFLVRAAITKQFAISGS